METMKDVVEAIQQGKLLVVTFRAGIDEKEGYAEKGMRARLIGVTNTSDAEVVSVRMDFSEFEAHNLPLESSNYYDSNQQPTRTARQAGYYKPQDDLYFVLGEKVSDLMDIEGDEAVALFSRFVEAAPSLSYVQWLERRVMELEAAAATTPTV